MNSTNRRNPHLLFVWSVLILAGANARAQTLVSANPSNQEAGTEWTTAGGLNRGGEPGAASPSRTHPGSEARSAKPPLIFEANEGQLHPKVQFVSRGRDYSMSFTEDGAVLSLRTGGPANEESEQSVKDEDRGTLLPGGIFAGVPDSLFHAGRRGRLPKCTALELRFLNANQKSAVMGVDQLPGRSNYFVGSDPKMWRTNIPTYAGVRYKDIYPGVDLFYYGNEGGQLEYDFVIAPGADPRAIALDVGTDMTPGVAGRKQRARLRIDANGDLVVRIDGTDIRFHKPIIYQPEPVSATAFPGSSLRSDHSSNVEGRFRLVHNHVKFQISTYDHSRPLVIDPVMVFSTYFGGSMGESSCQIRVDGQGNMYIAGNTASPDFPLANPLQNTLQAVTAAYVSKFTPDGSTLLYSTYIGGNDPGTGASAGALVVDESGNAYISGWTSEADFPTTPGAFEKGLDASCTPLNCGFVAKLGPDGSSLIFSTYFPASPWSIATDSSGNVYVTGQAGNGFPTTPGAFQTTQPGQNSGYRSAFVTKLNPTGTALVYSTFLGGSGADDSATAIAVDASGNAYVAGSGPLDVPAFTDLSPAGNGPSGGFVVKLNASGSGPLYSTFFGDAAPFGIAIDGSGNAYITGYIASTDFPRAGPMQTSFQDNDAFVSKLGPSGSQLVYSMFLGGSFVDWGYGIAADAAGNAYVTGRTQSIDFPLVNPVQPYYGGGPFCGWECSDVFVTEVSSDGSKLLFSTYVGDVAYEQGQGIATDNHGNIYVTGYTYSFDFPLAHAYQTTNKAQTGATAFVLKINAGIGVAPQRIIFGAELTSPYQPQPIGVSTAPQTVTFANNTQGSIPFSGAALSGPAASDFGVGSDSCSGSTLAGGESCTIDVTFTPSAGGMRKADLLLSAFGPGSPFDVSLRGEGTTVAVTPQIMDFGHVDMGTESTPQTLTVTNYGTSSLTVNKLYWPVVEPGVTISQNTCNGATLAPMAACTASITFSPPIVGGLQEALSVYDSAPDSPQVATIKGFGVGAQVTVTGPLGFYSQPVGIASAPQTVTVTNSGNANLIFAAGAITLSGANAAEFTIPSDGCGGQAVAPSGTCPVSVTFTPSTTGAASAMLSLADNTTNSPQTVPLYGSGVDFALGIASGSPSSATVSPGGTATYSLAVTEEGGTGTNVTISLTCTGAPSEAACSVSPSSLTLGGGVEEAATVTVTTTAASLSLRVWWTALAALLASAALVSLARRRQFGYVHASFVTTLLILSLLAAVALVSCGGGGSSGPPPNPGTPTGSYTLTVTATLTSSSGALVHSVPLTLNVN